MSDRDKNTAEVLLHSGEDLLSARSLSEALHRFQQAEAAGAEPDRCAAGRWTTNMLMGNFEAAWQESDAIRRRGTFDPHRFWQGESLRGKRVMLRCLHGFGDAIQFLRYAPRLRETASRLIIEVPPRLLELASYFDGVDEIVTWGEEAPAVAPIWDVQVESNELPYLFRTQLCDLPLTTNYLRIPKKSKDGQTELSSGRNAFQVGLVWTAGAWNPARSIPFALIQSLFNISGCEFWDLQGGPEMTKEPSLLNGMLRIEERCRSSVKALAAKIAELDLIITVDTLAAHLAGALGVPAWVLLQHEADWRWLHLRGDSPWYPSVRLFRQPTAGDWKRVIETVTNNLRERTCAAHSNGLVA
jgi:hypothetical protein